MKLMNSVAILHFLYAAYKVADKPTGVCAALMRDEGEEYSELGAKYEAACTTLMDFVFNNGEVYYWGNPHEPAGGYGGNHLADELTKPQRKTARLIAIYTLIAMLEDDSIDINDYAL